MTDLVPSPVVLEGAIGFLVTGHWCDRCGDTNYDPATRECLTCTFPDDPCSRTYLEGRAE
ncbi:hypothetical protein [Dactylosporangium salmoneum]|uniref:Uncharacterized protein n=1 Tax=Dactylosporangium salmoneum TaxID=53361 RepID=A0ABN3GAB2_9ACTN